MKSEFFPRLRVFVLAFAFVLLGTAVRSALPGAMFAQSDAPAAACDSGPNVICPDPSDPSAEYIASVTAVPDGVVLLLTDAGLERARACGGAAEIAAMAAIIYASIPEDQRAAFQLDWTSQTLRDEIYGHAFLHKLSGGVPGLDSIQERSNPINIVFSDYGGPGSMTTEARAEQSTYAVLGSLHRASC